MGIIQNIRENIWARLTPPDIRRVIEAIGTGVHLAEPGWTPLYGGTDEREIDPMLRVEAIQASYHYWQLDPLMSRAVQLIRDYTFGRGVTWNAPDPETQKAVSRFWDDRDNRIIAKAQGQWELSERLQLAGEVFFIFFVNRLNGAVKLRLVDPGEITQVITDPDDRERVLYYERRWRRQRFNWESKTWTAGEEVIDYIPNWNNANPDRATVGDASTYVCMHHIKINSHGLRGVPLYLRVIAWIRAYKGFMEDRATLTLAAATFAFKQKIRGSAAAVARMAAKWSGMNATQRYGGAGGKERTEGAQTLIENENVSLEQMQFNTNASNAYLDGRMLRQQVSAGTGITEQNLTGDPSVSNLASATQMEGPMQKMFESWQQLWGDEFVEIFSFVVEMAVKYGYINPPQDKWTEVNFPPIVTKDLPVIIGAVSGLISAQTQAGEKYVSDRRIATYILEAFGETDIDAALAELNLNSVTSNDAPAPEGMVEVNEDLSEADSTRLATILPKRVMTLPAGTLEQSMFLTKVTQELDEFGRLFVLALRTECPQSGVTGESGTLADSHRYEVVNKGSPDVALNVYAGNVARPEVVVRTVLFGSKAHTISAKPGKVLRFFWANGPDGPKVYSFASVQHPGTEANNYFQRAWEKVAPQRQAMIARIGALANEVISKTGYRKA